MEHLLTGDLLTAPITVHLVGVGGGGAQMAGALARIDIAIRALGNPHGLIVEAFDPGAVRAANVGRQVFSPVDVGQNKAVVMMHRINCYYGLDWQARPYAYESTWIYGRPKGRPDIIIGCVDSRATRAAIHESLFSAITGVRYWLDLGNREADGQVCLGQPPSHNVGEAERLPCITELYPEILDDTVREDNEPSCSLAIALESQGLFINDLAVRLAAQLLYRLLTRGRLPYHAVLFNLDKMLMRPLAVDVAAWRRFGLDRAVWHDASPADAQARQSAAPPVAVVIDGVGTAYTGDDGPDAHSSPLEAGSGGGAQTGDASSRPVRLLEGADAADERPGQPGEQEVDEPTELTESLCFTPRQRALLLEGLRGLESEGRAADIEELVASITYA